MNLINANDVRVGEISQEWLDFLDEHQDDLPTDATTLALGQVFLYFLMSYKPPLDELSNVLGFVVSIYAAAEFSDNSYKGKMN
jgi:hypothetical protein